MAVKKKAKKKSFKISKGFLGQKKLLFGLLGIALLIGGIAVLGFSSFAGGKPGRAISYKTTGVLSNYRVYRAAPSGFVYLDSGVYVNKTTPRYGSRALKPGMSGEDVKVLQRSLILYGNQKIRFTDGSVKKINDPSLFPSFAQVKITGNFDYQTRLAASYYKYGETASNFAGTFNGDMDVLELGYLARNASVPVGLSSGKGIVFNYKTGKLVYSGEIRNVSGRTKISTKSWTFLESNGAKEPIRHDGLGEVGLYSNLWTGWVNKTKPVFGSRILKKGMKGEDVKLLQSLLNANKVANPVQYKNSPKLKVDGNYGQSTADALSPLMNDGMPGYGNSFNPKTDGAYLLTPFMY